MALRIQRPTPPNEWLYQDRGENDRYFTTFVLLGKHEPEWAECTDEAKEEWDREHRPESEESQEPQNE